MSKLYIPGDPRSSPYTPMLGHPILFRPNRNTSDGRDVKPGFITRVYDNTPNDIVDITVFTPTGVFHFMRVPYSEDVEDNACWFWPKPLERRKQATPVEVSKPATVQAVTTG